MVEDEDGGVPQSRPEMGLCPAALQLMARSFSGLTRLEFQGALAAPHPVRAMASPHSGMCLNTF